MRRCTDQTDNNVTTELLLRLNTASYTDGQLYSLPRVVHGIHVKQRTLHVWVIELGHEALPAGSGEGFGTGARLGRQLPGGACRRIQTRAANTHH